MPKPKPRPAVIEDAAEGGPARHIDEARGTDRADVEHADRSKETGSRLESYERDERQTRNRSGPDPAFIRPDAND